MKTKDGKIVLETKADLDNYFKPIMESNPFSVSRDSSIYDVPKDIQKDLESRGLEPRWIDSKEYEADGNQHKNFWVPYRRPVQVSSGEGDAFEFKSGVSADGYVRRRGSILAVRPKQLGDKHRAMIKQKTLNQAKIAAASQESLRDEARRAGFRPEDLD